MRYEDKPIPMLIKRKKRRPRGANFPTVIEVYRCPCGRGKAEHHCVPGFDDDFYLLKCRRCKKRYTYVERVGNSWRLYLANPKTEP